MDSLNITDNITQPTYRRRQEFKGYRRDRSLTLTPEQKFTEAILSVGVLPAICIIGLMACMGYLLAICRKERNSKVNPFPIIIAIFDAIYLLLTLEDRIEHSLTTIFGVFDEGINAEIKNSMKRIAEFALSMGTAILCVHSIEVCHAVVRPMTFKIFWKKKSRLIIASLVITLGLTFFLSSQIAYFMIDDSQRPTFLSVRNSLEDGIFSILTISTMLCCYIIIIIRRVQKVWCNSSANNSTNTNDSTDKMILSLTMASSVYFLFGVPVDVVKLVLIYSQTVSRKGLTFWAVKVTQNIMEVLYGSALLGVFVCNEMVSSGFCSKCCTNESQTSEDEEDVICNDADARL